MLSRFSKALEFQKKGLEFQKGDAFGFVNWVPWKWVSELDAKIELLNAEIAAFYNEKGPNPENILYGYWPFEAKWATYYQNWRAWYIAHQQFHTRTTEESEIEFRAFRIAYDHLRTEFMEVEGGTTKTETAKPWIEVPPTEKTGLGEIGGINLWPIAIVGVAALGIVVLLKFKD